MLELLVTPEKPNEASTSDVLPNRISSAALTLHLSVNEYYFYISIVLKKKKTKDKAKKCRKVTEYTLRMKENHRKLNHWLSIFLRVTGLLVEGFSHHYSTNTKNVRVLLAIARFAVAKNNINLRTLSKIFQDSQNNEKVRERGKG